jgi:hypothetical protein
VGRLPRRRGELVRKSRASAYGVASFGRCVVAHAGVGHPWYEAKYIESSPANLSFVPAVSSVQGGLGEQAGFRPGQNHAILYKCLSLRAL